MTGYRFLLPAEEEMTEASLFYEATSAGLGGEFLDDVQRVIGILRRHPEVGRLVESELRLAPLRRFPFSLIYSVRIDEIIILAIAHQKRRPGYWKDRIGS